MEIRNLEPKLVFGFFEEILKIPRPSKHEEKIRQYLIDFAKKNNLEYQVDKTGNVLIKKPATQGYENSPTVILQSHLDMVPEKRTDVEHNFETDPIRAYVADDGWIKTYGTTLGADDGIGIAAAMAVLSDNSIEHPAIEALFTVDEETGMTGAFGIDENMLQGKILINLDSEDEGELFIGSAGGMDTTAVFEFSKEPAPENLAYFKINIDKLHGGHSGDEIHKGYANAIQLLDRFLWNIYNQSGLRLAYFEGGKLRNAIPKDAQAIIGIEKEKTDDFKANFEKFKTIFKTEYAVAEPNMEFTFSEAKTPDYLIDRASTHSLLWSLYAAPHGVYAWDLEMGNLVQTSTNLATLRIDNNKIIVGTSQRSSIDSQKMDIATKVRTAFELAGAEVSHGSFYPGWKPNPNSAVLKATVDAYKKLFGTEPVVRAIHAGLECGLFLEKYPHLDMISFGPTIRGAHTPDEKLEISTVQKFWDLLVEVLKNIK